MWLFCLFFGMVFVLLGVFYFCHFQQDRKKYSQKVFGRVTEMRRVEDLNSDLVSRSVAWYPVYVYTADPSVGFAEYVSDIGGSEDRFSVGDPVVLFLDPDTRKVRSVSDFQIESRLRIILILVGAGFGIVAAILFVFFKGGGPMI